MRGTLSAVRYKAEAGLSKRGWMPGLEGDERLIGERAMMSSSDDGFGVDAESPSPAAANYDDEEDEGGQVRGRVGRLERDDMKLPAGDGWKPLA